MDMSEYPQALADLLEDFSKVIDRQERTELLIEYADRFRPVPEQVATRPFDEAHRVPACESEVYVWADQQPDNTLRFYFAVENPQGLSAKAMAAILDQTLSGLPPEQVARVQPDIVLTIFGKDISMGKGQGLTGMVAMVQTLAKQYLAG